MQYLLIGTDGQEYGPADFRTLQQWAADDRLTPNSRLRDVQSGAEIVAGSLPDLFPQPTPASAPMAATPTPAQPDWSQPPSPYTRTTAALRDSFPWRVIIYSALGLVLFFVLQGIGIVFAGFAVYYAFLLKSEGSKWWPLGLGVSLLSLAAILIGFYLRSSGGG